ncbi:MAG: O-antigen ligase [Halieaceae bacterium]|jgi:O-antigen ligase
MTRSFMPLPALLLLPAMALMPFGRMVEIPLGLLSLSGLAVSVLLLSGSWRRAAGVDLRLLGLLYCAFLLPMLVALPDAVAIEKSTITTLGTARYFLFCMALLWLFQRESSPTAVRGRVLELLGLTAVLLLTLWCLDGLLQFATGRNVLGYGMAEGYINGVFGEDDNIKLGVTVALLLPLALVHTLRRWPLPAVLLFLLLVLTLITLSGKRAAWIITLVELSALAIYYRGRGRLGARHLLAGAALLLAAAVAAYAVSDWVKLRSDVLVEAVDNPDFATLNRASGKRLPIWRTALHMGGAHWVNGVGPRGFRYAYTQYAEEGDAWAKPLSGRDGARASHAHQLLLEVFCETGVVGLAGLLVFLVLLLRSWWRASTEARSRALPYAVSLLGMLFPLNTHAAWYSSWSASLLWLLIGLYLYALAEPAKINPAQDPPRP